MPIVKTRHLSKTYVRGDTEVHALQDVNLQIERGSFVSVMGPSGSGKSTLLNMLGLLDRPSEGEIFIDGQATSGLTSAEVTRIRREQIGFVFQSFNLIPTLTSVENVMLPLRYEKVAGAKEIATTALKLVGLSHRMNFRPNEMSGGEQQRVAIARALVLKPAIVLADEPTGELDSKNSKAIMALMKELNQKEQQTFVIVTHDPAVAAQTELTLMMKDGRFVGAKALGGDEEDEDRRPAAAASRPLPAGAGVRRSRRPAAQPQPLPAGAPTDQPPAPPRSPQGTPPARQRRPQPAAASGGRIPPPPSRRRA